MDYVPIYADDSDGLDAAVKISPTLINNLGVRTALARRERLTRQIATVGYLGYDERLMSHVHLRTTGWVENLNVRALGERVKKGELLFEVYSPDLVNAQEEYLLALAQDNPRLRRPARDRLLALGLAETQIRQLEKQGRSQQLSQVYARQDGVLTTLNIREGMYVMPELELMTLADVSSIWVMVDVFERQAAALAVGQTAEVRIPFLPGEVWTGEVEYIYPDLDPQTRTVRARLRFANPDGRLKPNMFAEATIHAEPREALSIPREALILHGDGARVMVDRGAGRFEAVTVEPGIESGERVEIRAGLNDGERVVVSAQFLLDSEASLRASLLRMSAAEEPATPLIWATAQVNDVRAADHKVNLFHAPIPAIGWPEMAMDFAVDPGVDLDTLKLDDNIRFALKTTPDGYVITAIEKQP